MLILILILILIAIPFPIPIPIIIPIPIPIPILIMNLIPIPILNKLPTANTYLAIAESNNPRNCLNDVWYIQFTIDISTIKK